MVFMSNHLRIKSKKIVFVALIMLLPAILSSCAQHMKVADIENYLNSLIGRQYDPALGFGENWKKIYEDEKNIELETRVRKDCSYSIHIPKDTYRIDSWKFTSPRSGCENIYVFL
jgi:hypothetical protein